MASRVDTRVFVQNSREFHAKRVSYFATKKLLVSRNFVFRETGCSLRKPVSNGSYFEKQNWNLNLNLKNTFWVNLAKLLYVTDYFALHVIFVCNYNFFIAIICYSDSSFLCYIDSFCKVFFPFKWGLYLQSLPLVN